MSAVPAWITEQQWKDLNPPAEVRQLGELPRSAEKLIAASLALMVKSAKRYAPTKVTWCNIYAADVLQILGAPLPHWFDLGDGKGRREMTANLITQGLRDGKFPGWEALGVLAKGQLAAANRAALGIPTVAVWKNPTGSSGHIVLVVPTPAGKSGVYVTGAGRHCVESCRLVDAFDKYTPHVEFFSYRDSAPVCS